MAHWTGYFDSSGAPRLKISIYGCARQFSKEFDVVVDTGFSGFVSMPIIEAFPLGLILCGTTTTILADGSQSFKLTAVGTAFIEKEEQAGIILLNVGSGPSDVLVGMEFLKTFRKTLFVHDQVVALLDTDEVNKWVSAAALEASKLLSTAIPEPGLHEIQAASLVSEAKE